MDVRRGLVCCRVGVLAVASVLAGCGSDADVAPPVDDGTAAPAEKALVAGDTTWQWQLQGDIDTGHDVDLYDIDLFDVPRTVVDELHADGRIVVCYYSAGSWEEWRDDAGSFPADVLGAGLDGWEGERWVDTRSDVVRSLIDDRHDLAADKGCDGVEPDNVTAFQADSGFDLSAADQLDFNRFVAASAHQRGLLVALKNDLDQIPDLVDEFDFAVNEQCIEYDECDAYGPFLDAGKAVLNAEYADRFVENPRIACDAAVAEGIRTLVLSIDLDDSFRYAC